MWQHIQPMLLLVAFTLSLLLSSPSSLHSPSSSTSSSLFYQVNALNINNDAVGQQVHHRVAVPLEFQRRDGTQGRTKWGFPVDSISVAVVSDASSSSSSSSSSSPKYHKASGASDVLKEAVAAVAAAGSSSSSSSSSNGKADDVSSSSGSGSNVVVTRPKFNIDLGDALSGSKKDSSSSPTRKNSGLGGTRVVKDDIIPTPSSDPFNGNGTISKQIAAASSLNVYTGIAATILLATGILLVFWGHHLFKPILFIAGFYVFGIIGYSVLQFIEFKTGNHFGDSRDLVYLIICLVSGLVGGALFTCFWQLGISAIGALLGFVLAVVILSFVSDGTISSGLGRDVFILVMAIAGAIAIHFVERPILIIGTATAGAFAVMTGVDIFAQTGFTDATHTFLSGKGGFTVTIKTVAMLIGFFILALIGIVHQWHQSRQRGHHKGLRERDEMRKNGTW